MAKGMVEEIISNHAHKPKHIHVRLEHNQYKRILDIMPTLEQVQNFIANRYTFGQFV